MKNKKSFRLTNIIYMYHDSNIGSQDDDIKGKRPYYILQAIDNERVFGIKLTTQKWNNSHSKLKIKKQKEMKFKNTKTNLRLCYEPYCYQIFNKKQIKNDFKNIYFNKFEISKEIKKEVIEYYSSEISKIKKKLW